MIEIYLLNDEKFITCQYYYLYIVFNSVLTSFTIIFVRRIIQPQKYYTIIYLVVEHYTKIILI